MRLVSKLRQEQCYVTSFNSNNHVSQHSLRNTTRHPFKIFHQQLLQHTFLLKDTTTRFSCQLLLVIAEQMARVVGYPFYMMVDRITRTVSTIIKTFCKCLKLAHAFALIVKMSYNKTLIDFNFCRHKDLSTLKNYIKIFLSGR